MEKQFKEKNMKANDTAKFIEKLRQRFNETGSLNSASEISNGVSQINHERMVSISTTTNEIL